jgi:hypothetical protein
MRTVRDASEDEMVLAFLLGEIDSRRFACVREALADPSLVTDADLSDAAANDRRRDILTACRGYETRTDLFDGFPQRVAWKLVEVTTKELGNFRYVRIEPWTELAPSRLVSDGARNETSIAEGVNEHIRAIVVTIQAGKKFPWLIAAAEGEHECHHLIEGHARATAMVRTRSPHWTERVIVGYVPDLSKWRWR